MPGPVVLGRANLDPARGEGRREAIEALLAHPDLADPRPAAPSGAAETVFWDGVGPMRVDYVLPSRAWRVLGAGILGADADDPLHEAAATVGPGRLVWVEVDLPPVP